MIESVPSEEFGNYDYSQEITEAHLAKIVGSLEATNVTATGNLCITEDDCVALLIFDGELSQTELGTVQEAYESTFKRLLTWSSIDEINEVMEHFYLESVISWDKNEFDKALEIDTLDNKKVYINRAISAYEMGKASYALAEKFDFEFVWLKDKAGREVLLEYSSK